MEVSASREELSGSDLECSRSDSEWNSEKLSALTENEGKRTWGLILSSLSSFGVSTKPEYTSPPKISGKIVDERVELLIINECGGDFSEKNTEKKKQKRNKKASKPPRPPKGPSLDAADMIYMKEITELAMKRRERIERLRSVKKSKEDKNSSFNNSTTALFITFLFFIVILLQALSSRNNGSSGPGREGFISVHYFNNISPFDSNAPVSASSKFIIRLLTIGFFLQYDYYEAFIPDDLILLFDYLQSWRFWMKRKAAKLEIVLVFF